MKLSEIAFGALQELFDREYQKVMENIQDINTKDTVKPKSRLRMLLARPHEIKNTTYPHTASVSQNTSAQKKNWLPACLSSKKSSN